MTTYANVIIDCKTVLRAHGSIGCARGGSGNLNSGDKWNFCLTSA